MELTKFSLWLLARNITTEDLAKMTGRSVFTCRSWRVGARQPSKEGREALCSALGITEQKLRGLLR